MNEKLTVDDLETIIKYSCGYFVGNKPIKVNIRFSNGVSEKDVYIRRFYIDSSGQLNFIIESECEVNIDE